jgi:c-di-GMP-related signal transduction protein
VGVSEDFIEFRENIIISEVPNVLNTRKLRITINLPPSSEVLDPDVEQVLEFKSAGIFYLTL